MRTEYRLFLGLGLFMLPLGLVYLWLSSEPAGIVLILVVALSFTFIGVYLAIQSRRMRGFRPEDYDATQAEGAGEVGSFPGASIWPFVGAVSITVISYGLVFSTWLAIPGLALLLATVIGMARESEVSGVHHEDLDALNQIGVTESPTFSDQVKK